MLMPTQTQPRPEDEDVSIIASDNFFYHTRWRGFRDNEPNAVEPDTAGVSRIDALTHEFDNPRKFVGLYALVGKLRLFAAANVVSRVEEVMRRIAETYNLPNRDFRNPEGRQEHDVDVLRALSEAC
jgi:hypothetical protein